MGIVLGGTGWGSVWANDGDGEGDEGWQERLGSRLYTDSHR